ncbi:MAG: IS66 family transposase [Chloroflexi bacterium]|nr:IS66 family transposase [Chloroflexota bacterium]
MTLEEEVVQLRAELAEARVLIAKLQQELERLRSERSEPPSFVKPNTDKPKDQAQKQPRRKRANDQNGARRREQNPTQTIQHTVEQCPTCAYPLQHPQLALRRQVIELPPPQPVEVTEHQLYKSWCPRCEKWHQAHVDLAGQVIGQQGRMGVRIASLIAYLRTSLRMPVRLIREYLHAMHNLLLSTGEIVELLHRTAQAEKVAEAAQAVKERVRKSRIVHGDETGWREGGQNGYVWCFCTPEGERYYEYDKSRAGAVARRILGSQYKGTLVTDFYAAYNDFPGEHQRCWVHLLRDLHKLKEEHKDNQEVLGWAAQLRQLYDTAQDALHGKGSGGSGGRWPPTQGQREMLYIELVEGASALAGRYASTKEHSAHPCHTLSKRLMLHQDSLFQFVLQEGLSADNNLAERSIRPVVVMRKVSGGTQSERGSRTRMTLASLFGTWRAKGLNPFSECLLLLSLPSTP